jgi:hypothetical protein
VQTYVGMSALAGRTCPAGYGFGLNLRDDPKLGTVVAHAGGLPGYGSNMRWIAGSGVAAIALANVTYAPMWTLTMQMLDTLHDHGAVPPRTPVEAPAVHEAASRLVALLNEWDDSAAVELFADNVGLDESFARRRVAAAHLVEQHGELSVERVIPESTTAGRIEVRGTRSPFVIEFDLAPLPGAPLQYYGLKDDDGLKE